MRTTLLNRRLPHLLGGSPTTSAVLAERLVTTVSNLLPIAYHSQVYLRFQQEMFQVRFAREDLAAHTFRTLRVMYWVCYSAPTSFPVISPTALASSVCSPTTNSLLYQHTDAFRDRILRRPLTLGASNARRPSCLEDMGLEFCNIRAQASQRLPFAFNSIGV